MKLAADACYQACETFCTREELTELVNMSDEIYTELEESFDEFVFDVEFFLRKQREKKELIHKDQTKLVKK